MSADSLTYLPVRDWVPSLWMLRPIEYGGSDTVPVFRPKLRQHFLLFKTFLLGSLNLMWTGSKPCGEWAPVVPSSPVIPAEAPLMERRSYLGNRSLQPHRPPKATWIRDKRPEFLAETEWLFLNSYLLECFVTQLLITSAYITYDTYLVMSVPSASRLLEFEFHHQDLVAMGSQSNYFNSLCLSFVIYKVRILKCIS